MRVLGVSVISALFLFASVVSFTDQAEVGRWEKYSYGNLKNYVVNMVKDGILSRSEMARSFQWTMNRIRTRYAEAQQNGELDGKDEVQAQALYYKIVVEELRILRESIKVDPSVMEELKPELEKINQDSQKIAKVCSVCGGKSCPHDCQKIMGMESEEEDEKEELELLNELDALEENLAHEDEMGWALSEEGRQALRLRTKAVLADLMSNEIRQLAMELITSYMIEGATGTVAVALKASIKFKLVQYLMNCVMDLLASIMGARIQLTPIEQLAQPPVQQPILAST